MNKLKGSFSEIIRGQRHKGLRSFVAVLMAFSVVFTVYGSLIEPAVSTTHSDAQIEQTGYGTMEMETFGAPSLSGTPMPIGTASGESEETGVYQVTSNVPTPTADSQGNIVYDAKLGIDFYLNQVDVLELYNNRDTYGSSVSFKIFDEVDGVAQWPEGFQVVCNNQDEPTAEGEVKSQGEDSQVIGDYFIDFNTNTAIVTFDFDCQYFQKYQQQSIEPISGGIEFNAWFWNDDESTNDRTVNIAGNEVTIPIHRAAHGADLNVTKEYNNDFFYGTQGDSMQGKAELGSSFKLTVSSNYGIDGTEVIFTDTLTSNHVHFDRSPGYKETLANGVVLEILSIETNGSTQTMSAKLTAPDLDTFKNGFSVDWNCPVAVNDEYLTDGKVDPNKFGAESSDSSQIIAADNNVVARTTANGGKTSTASAPMQVNLKADIAKSEGVYDAATNTVHWVVTIFKSNGWWQDGTITLQDFLQSDGNEYANESARQASTLPGQVFKDSKLTDFKIVPYENSINDRIDPFDDAHKSEYSDLKVEVGDNGVVISMPTTLAENNKYYGNHQIKEFVLEYDTPVDEDDYGSEINNWIGMKRPNSDTYTDQDNKPGEVPSPSISKTGTFDETDNTISWAITVRNPYHQDLSGLNIVDSETATKEGLNSTLDLSKITSVVGSSGENVTDKITKSGDVLTFPDNGTDKFTDDFYTIVYKQEIDLENAMGETFNNSVQLKTKTNKVLSEDSEPVEVPEAFGIDKRSGFSGDSINYSIDLINKYKTDIGNNIVSDTLVLNSSDSSVTYSADDFTAVVDGATKVGSYDALTAAGSPSGLLYYEEKSGNTYNIYFNYHGEMKDSYTINYSLSYNDGPLANLRSLILNNHAWWKDDDIDDDTEDKVQDVTYAKIESKTGSYDEKTNILTWTIVIDNPYAIDLGKYTETVDGTPVPQYVYDSMFGKDKVLSFKITDAQGEDRTAEGDLEFVNSAANVHGTSYEKWGQVNDVTWGTYRFHEGMNSTKYTIVYQTEFEDYAEKDGDNVTNYAVYDRKHKEDTKWVGTKKWLEKSVDSVSDADENGDADITWKVKVTTYEGGLIKYPVTDVMTASYYNKENGSTTAVEGIQHYMTADQFKLENFTITATDKNGNAVAISDEEKLSLFELEATEKDGDKVKAFEFRANENALKSKTSDEYQKLASIMEIVISYTTTQKGAGTIFDKDPQTGDDLYNSGDKLIYNNTTDFVNKKSSKDNEYVKSPLITKYDEKNNTDGNDPTEYSLSSLTPTDGYYTFKYKIVVNEGGTLPADLPITAKDTMPEYMELLSATYNGQEIAEGDNSETAITYKASTADSTVTDQETGDETTVTSNVYTFNIPASLHRGNSVTINYTVKISEEDLNAQLNDPDNISQGQAMFSNSAEVNDDIDNQPFTVTDDNQVLNKVGVESESLTNTVTYTLEINKQAQDLIPDSDIMTLTDTINKNGGNDLANAPIYFNDISSNSIKVYEVDSQGSEKLLDPTLYSMQAPEKVRYQVATWIFGKDVGDGDVYIMKMNLPDEKHLKVVYTYSYYFNDKVRNDSTFDATKVELKNSAVIDGNVANKDVTNKLKRANKNSHSGYAYTYAHYSLRKFSSDNWTHNLKDAVFNVFRYSAEDGWEVMTDAKSYTDVWTTNPDSGTEVRTNATVGEFGQGEPYDLVTNENGIVEIPSFQEIYEQDSKKTLRYYTEADGTQKYIYLLKEVKSPSGYYLTNDKSSYYFYEVPTGVADISTIYPTKAVNALTATGEVTAAQINALVSNSVIELPNDRMELDVRKQWTDKNDTERPESITVKLWKSKTPPAASDTIVTAKVNYVVKDGSAEVFNKNFYFTMPKGQVLEFKLLEEGVTNTNLGSGLYNTWNNYIIKSNDPITEDTEFNIVANKNGNVNVSMTQVTEVGIRPNTEFTPEGEAIETVELNKGNNWYHSFDTSSFDSTYYYYVTEENVPDGYFASYPVNGVRNGEMVIENVEDNVPKGSITVDKSWLKNEAADTDMLQFQIKGYTDKVPQDISEYSTLNRNEAVVQFKIYNSYNESQYKLFKFAAKKNAVYTLYSSKSESGGNGIYNNCLRDNNVIINGQTYSIYSNLSNGQTPVRFGDNNNGDAWFNIPVNDDYLVDGVMTYEVALTWTEGNYSAFNFTCTDSASNPVTLYGESESLPEPEPADPSKTYKKATVNLPNGEFVVNRTLTMTKDDQKNWVGTVGGLPLTYNGDTVYYYVVESDGSNFVPINYSDNGFTLSENQLKTVKVLNEKTEESGFELPESGGSGTALYYLTGAGLMISAGLYYSIRKRRNAS